MTTIQKEYLLEIINKDIQEKSLDDVSRRDRINKIIDTLNTRIASTRNKRDALVATRDELSDAIQSRLNIKADLEAVIPVD